MSNGRICVVIVHGVGDARITEAPASCEVRCDREAVVARSRFDLAKQVLNEVFASTRQKVQRHLSQRRYSARLAEESLLIGQDAIPTGGGENALVDSECKRWLAQRFRAR